MKYEYALFEKMIIELCYPIGPEHIDFYSFCAQVIDEKNRVITLFKSLAESNKNNNITYRNFIIRHFRHLLEMQKSLVKVKRPYREYLNTCLRDIEQFMSTCFNDIINMPQQAAPASRKLRHLVF